MGTEPPQGFMVGVATQSPSGRVWGDPFSRLPHSTPWRQFLSPGSPVRTWKSVNLNTKLPWPKSWKLAKVYLRPPTLGNGLLFTLVKATYLGPTARGWPKIN